MEVKEFCALIGEFLFFFIYYWIMSVVDFCRQFVYPKRKSVKGDIVLITGGAGGLGSHLCREFLKLGAIVVILDVNDEAMNNLKLSVQQETGKVIHCYNCDASSREDVFHCASKVKEEVGCVSILINNVGIVIGKKLLEYSEQDLHKAFSINVFSYFWTVQAFLPDMIERQHGHIVCISSVANHFGVVGLSEYCATKAAVSIMMEVLVREIYKMGLADKIHTSSINPYFIQTDMFKHCSLRFPKFITPLDTDYCVNRIMAAILSNQRLLMIGSNMYFFVLLKYIMPQRCSIEWDELIGTNDFMVGFSKNTRLNNP